MSTALLISGGQDSAALAFWHKPKLGIFVNYGQVPWRAELRASRIICEELQIPIEVISADCTQMGSGQLADKPQLEIGSTPEWWPFRNQLLLTLAGAVAVRKQISELLIGTVASDVRHRDGTLEFIRLIDNLVSIQEGHLHVRAPAIQLS
jgi:7-cyano-7-deazaguanine synthase